jgi:hypothetical protein
MKTNKQTLFAGIQQVSKFTYVQFLGGDTS